MKFKNSSFYVQRQMDKILKKFRVFCRIYIDDIVIFSITLKNHVKHFSAVFNKFQNLNITLNFNKIYIGYPSVMMMMFFAPICHRFKVGPCGSPMNFIYKKFFFLKKNLVFADLRAGLCRRRAGFCLLFVFC